jgi:hypothetical protein
MNTVLRPTSSAYSNTWTTIATALFSHNQDHERFSPNFWGFHESGTYLGLFVVPALIGLLRPRRALPWLAAIFVVVMLARGDIGPNSFWVYLHRLPVASSMRLPSRFLMMATLAVAVLAGLGFDLMLSSRWRIVPFAAVVLLVSAVVDNAIVVAPNLNYALGNQPVVAAPHPVFRQYLLNRAAAANTYRIGRENTGVIDCYEYTDWITRAVGADQPGYRGEEYMQGPGKVQLLEWSPNKLSFQVDTPAASTLVINQNYDRSWRAVSAVGTVYSQGDLLAVRVPAGKNRITVKYICISGILGGVVTLLTAIAAMIMVRRSRPSGERLFS